MRISFKIIQAGNKTGYRKYLEVLMRLRYDWIMQCQRKGTFLDINPHPTDPIIGPLRSFPQGITPVLDGVYIIMFKDKVPCGYAYYHRVYIDWYGYSVRVYELYVPDNTPEEYIELSRSMYSTVMSDANSVETEDYKEFTSYSDYLEAVLDGRESFHSQLRKRTSVFDRTELDEGHEMIMASSTRTNSFTHQCQSLIKGSMGLTEVECMMDTALVTDREGTSNPSLRYTSFAPQDVATLQLLDKDGNTLASGAVFYSSSFEHQIVIDVPIQNRGKGYGTHILNHMGYVVLGRPLIALIPAQCAGSIPFFNKNGFEYMQTVHIDI